MIQMSKNHYNTLLYWANVGYGAKGKLYEEQFPKRKSPWYKINQGALNCTVSEELSEYILKLQKENEKAVSKILKKPSMEITDLDVFKVRHCDKLVHILLEGYDLVQGNATYAQPKDTKGDAHGQVFR